MSGGSPRAGARALELVERVANLLREEGRRGALRGFDPVQWQVLGYLSRCNRFSDHAVAVAEYLGLTKGTVSQTLNRLEERRLLTRRPDVADRRLVHLRLTRAGARAAARRFPEVALRALDAAGTDADELERILERLLRRMVEERGGRLFGACHSCRHLERMPAGYRCGLLGEPLTADDIRRICREQEPVVQRAS